MRSALVFLAILLVHSAPSAQGSRADYERLENFVERHAGLVLRLVEEPEWLDEETLWYETTAAVGRREVVLARTDGGRRVLTSNVALSKDLGRKGTDLSVVRVALAEDGAAHLLLDDGGACTLAADGSTAPLDPTTIAAWRTESTVEGRGPAGVLFVNRTDGPVRIFWHSGSGERHYGRIAPGESRWQRSHGGHRWVVRNAAGEQLARFRVRERASVLVVDAAAEGEALESEPPAARRGVTDRRRKRARTPGRVRFRDHDAWLHPKDREPLRLTTDGAEHSPYRGPARWSDDARHLLLRRVDEVAADEAHAIEVAPDGEHRPRLLSWDYRRPGDLLPHSHFVLLRVDPEADPPLLRRVPIDESLFPNPYGLSRVRWNEDSSGFTFVYDERGHQLQRLCHVDAETGDVRVVVENASDTFVDHSQKTYLHHLGDGRLLWASERSGWNHLELVELATGERRALTEGEWLVRSVEDVDEERGHVLVRLMGYHPDQDPYHVHWAFVPLDGGPPLLLTEGDGTHELEFSPDGELYVDRWSRVDSPPVVELRRTEDGSLVCELERADWTPLLASGWQAPERFVAKGRDGVTDVWGVAWRPSGFDPTERYPVVERIYAGPHDHHVPKTFAAARDEHALAELGFLVVRIDGMGTNWRSKAFHDVCWRNLADGGLPDRALWLGAFGEHEPAADLTRVGVAGGSAGGQNALAALLHHPETYHVAVADCGCHDNRVDKLWWNEAWMGWPVGPWYEESSNVTHAAKLEGALLLIVGALDRNVDPASTFQVVDALVKADKDFDLVVLPSAGHSAGTTSYGLRRERDFLVRHLHGREPRWE